MAELGVKPQVTEYFFPPPPILEFEPKSSIHSIVKSGFDAPLKRPFSQINAKSRYIRPNQLSVGALLGVVRGL
jgi:hypothetical protein